MYIITVNQVEENENAGTIVGS